MNFLIVDDSTLARKMIIKALTPFLKEGDNTFEASDGKQAFEKYQEEKIDLVFLDLTMPVLDGFGAIKLIKEYDKDAKIFVVSADIQQGSMNRANDLGALGFVKKPINEEKIENILKRF